MRATRAYITGFGTTGLLVAAAFMSLFVMSAYVAFNGFPGQDVQNPVGSLLVQERQAPVSSVPVKPVADSSKAAARHQATAAARRRHHRHAVARRAVGPTASTGPVVHRTAPTSQPQSSSGTSVPTPDVTTPVHKIAPSLPSTPVTSPPSTGLPQVQLPPVQTQLPTQVNTLVNGVGTGVTNLVGGK
ncbi:MAG TPA: hypothetical protein VGI67_09180 [Thermoleophilaceae bacterium]|jgi:hypothetical protein